MDITPVLNLNRHPRDCDDCSLIDAENIMLSNDQSVLVTEPSITYNKVITKTIEDYYTDILTNYKLFRSYSLFDANGKALYKVIGCIECSEELIIFVGFRVKDITDRIHPRDERYIKKLYNRAVIFRYRTTDNVCKVSYDYKGGISIEHISENDNSKIKGTFTYNVDNSLIIAIAEYYKNENKIPLRTINLGTFEGINNEYSDLNVDNNLLSSAPEVYLPNMTNQSYVKGSSKKGWNYFFIRFKINKVDYTSWFPFGHPIYIDSIEQVNIIKYGFNQCIASGGNNGGLEEVEERRVFPSFEPVGYVTGCSDYISNKGDVANITAKFDIVFNNYEKLVELYKEDFIYQIGVICSSKSYTEAYTTFDINNNINNNNEFILNINNMNSSDNMEFINDNFNYYNVKNITTYKNRLYIANYKTADIDNVDIEKYTDNITLKCKVYKTDNENDYLYNIGLIRISTDIKTDVGVIDPTESIESGEGANIDKQSYQFDCDSRGTISLTTFLNVSGDTIVFITDDGETEKCNAKDVYIKKKNSNSYASEILISTPRNGKRWGKIKIQYGNNITEFNTNAYYGLTPIPYINVNNTFNNRIKNTTLIPGEIYNFYIHFIDKYGQFTNGYRLHNNTTHKYNNEKRVVFKYDTMYVSFPINQNVAKDGILNTDNILFHGSLSYTGQLGIGHASSGNIDKFIEQYSIYSKDEYNTIKWYQITDVPLITNTDMPQCFGYFENNNGEDLFKVPDYYTTTFNKKMIGLDVSNVVIPDGYVGYFISHEKFEVRQIYTGLLTNSDFRTNHYRTDFNIGGEKEWGQRYTRSDIMFAPLNFRNSNKMHFYTSQITTGDKIKFNYSILKLRLCTFPPDKYDRYWQQAPFFKYPKDLNKPILNIDDNVSYYPIPKYKLAAAESVQDGRMGLGTCIEMDNDYNLFGEIPYVGNTNNPLNGDPLPKMFIATLINANRDVYMGKTKILVRCSEYYYEDSPKTITDGLNGRFTYEGVIIYDGHGITFNEADGSLKGINNGLPFYPETAGFLSKDETTGNRNDTNEKYGDGRFNNPGIAFKYSYDAYTPFMNYVQFGVYTDIMYESKSFNNAPKGKVFKVYAPGPLRQDTLESEPSFVTGVMVIPLNSIDLFENRQASADEFNPKTYVNLDKNSISVEQFDKRIRRSNVIKDESRINAWRKFPLEGYKDITENKGIITNLYGVGTVFLVHTEHSLFMFDIDNTMKTEGKSIQLYQPDTFDVDYKEVVTSNLGYGGLQDSNSWIADQFGYLFYNRDAHRFFIFDANQLGSPDEEIVEFLSKYRPDTCIFFNDKEHHRLLIKMCYKNNTKDDKVILSFNYDTKKFISRHTYEFENAFNTKIESFMLFNDGVSDKFYQFVKSNESYSIFENKPIINGKATTQYVPVYARQAPVSVNSYSVLVKDGNNPYFSPAKLKIVVNNNYSLVKFIEYITYKLYKINAAKNDNAFSPVEERIVPFSGVSLRVYNDQIDTSYIDILIDLEEAKNVFANYEKPYWDLGNWNFSYLRNTKLSNVDDVVSRLYGNWFVFEFVINNDDNKVEFESLMVNLSKDKRV